MNKNISIIILILTIVTGTISCSKFLERPPEGQMTEAEALKTESDITAFANGVYTLLSDNVFLGGRHQVMNELLGDEYLGDFFTGDYSEVYKRQNSIFGGTRDDYYKKAYAVITRSNIILSKLDLATTQRNLIEGEAKLFRAIGHFEMVRMFAQPWGYTPNNSHLGIPLRTKVDISSVQRSTVAEVYAQVIADLKDAENLLPEVAADGKFYTATKWAAKAYLAKVYFQQNDFPNAFSAANDVIASQRFSLDTDYTQRFSKGLSKEGILAIRDSTGAFTPGSGLRDNFRSDVSLPGFRFTTQYYTVANARSVDKRKVWYSNTLQPGYNVLTKYNKNNFDLPLVHLTEIKLIRAEAGAESGGANLAIAITDINDILTRAYGSTAFNLPATASAASVITNARTEREFEMVGEGNRTQEIKRIGVRSGQNVDRRGSVWSCNGFILQFPKAEFDANQSFQLNPEGGCF